MKKIKKLCIILIGINFILAINSCTKEIQYKIKDNPNLLTINSILTADSIIKIDLFKSTDILAPDDTTGNRITQGAKLVLKDLTNGTELIVTNTDTLGAYNSGMIAVSGHEYSIEVSYPGFETATAKTRVPYSYGINSVSMVNQSDTVTESFKLHITPNANTCDYFCVRLQSINTMWNFTSYYSIYKDTEGNSYSSYCFFDKTYLANLSNVINVNIVGTVYKSYSPIVVLYSFSDEMYKYLQSYINFNQTGGEINGMFTEPILMYSNVENGTGIFAGKAQVEMSIFQ